MPGRMRPSKLVMTRGPGALVDMPVRESLLLLAPSFWAGHERVEEDRLAKRLGVRHFGVPLETKDSENHPVAIPVIDFPILRNCPSCRRLTTKKECSCHGPELQKTMGPRLVAACARGHLEDFPWKEWVGCKCPPGQEDLYLIGTEGEIYTSDLKVECHRCNTTPRDLRGALREEGVHRHCSGKRPWHPQGGEPCDLPLRGLMRGASNVYFPSTVSALSIPPFTSRVHKFVRPYVNNFRGSNLREVVRVTQTIRRRIEDRTFKEEEVIHAFEDFYGDSQAGVIKEEEWPALLDPEPAVAGDDFVARPLPLGGSPLDHWFQRVTVVSHLREVMALEGFSRIDPPNECEESRLQTLRTPLRPDEVEESGNDRLPPLWLPGIELFGEGIFFQFQKERTEAWATGYLPRATPMLNAPRAPLPPRQREGVDVKDARLVLVHTFAHLLIRSISLACGYAAASLSERLYVQGPQDAGRDLCGVLIYTSSSDSEGTLGGLVEQARATGVLTEHVLRALASARRCSQDPLCASQEPSSTREPWGASCHACTQLPETSCERLMNKLLDRQALVDPALGYFRDAA